VSARSFERLMSGDLQMRSTPPAGDDRASLDVFIGGGGDDLMPGGGVLRDYARRHAAETGRRVAYFANARVGRIVRTLRGRGAAQIVNLIGHSWGGPDAYRVAEALAAQGRDAAALITLDPVAGPLRRPRGGIGAAAWLDVCAAPRRPDRSDRLATLRPWSRKPSQLPTHAADRRVVLDLHHWDVAGMMALAGGRDFLAWAARRGSREGR